MNLLKKIFSPKQKSENHQETVSMHVEAVSLDDAFVQNFISKGGKFLYCTHQEEVNQNIVNIIAENQWEKVNTFDDDLKKLLVIVNINSSESLDNNYPFFTTCEHLISDEGSILFSSQQVRDCKIINLPKHFIVFAKTSQLVRNKSEALMGIRKSYQKDFPTNISSIKSYIPERENEDFLSYGNHNSKDLYLILLEDL